MSTTLKLYRLWNVSKNECEMVNDNLAQLVVEFGNGNLVDTQPQVFQILKQQNDGSYIVIMTLVQHMELLQ